MALLSGTRLGPYEILSPIGAGGMGEVYRARDTKLDRDVAIKILPEEFASDPDRLARFEREAKLLASLNHPNIASIYGLEESDGVKALVLELVEGPTLAERIQEGPIPVEETLAIAKQITEALEAGHEAGVIHRDLKPANIKLKEDGTVKVLDYGLAKALEGETVSGADTELSQSPTLTRQGTQVGVILGTASYMSPEQAKGKRVDKRTDIWAFGAVLFEMLTGRKAFSGADVSETLAAILKDEPDWNLLPKATPTKARELLSRCLEKNPRERLRDAGDARLRLDDALREEAPTAIATERTPRLGYALAALAGATVCGAVFLALPGAETPRAKRFSVSLPAIETLVRGPGSPILLAPDGVTLVYAGQRGDQTQLYRRRLDELEATAIDRTSGARHPFVSPDGRSLGFYLGGQIQTAPLDGGLPTKLADLGSPPFGPAGAASWGTDGFVYFVRSESEPLFRVPASGGDPEPATNLDADAGELAHMWPEALPNGRGVLFTIWSGSFETTKLGVHSFETGSHKILSPGTQPRYVPTGHILFTEGFTLYAAPFDPNRLELTGAAVPIVDNVEVNPSGAGQFSVSSNGILGYVESSGAGMRDTLMWVDHTGSTMESAMEDPERGLTTFRLAPDGKRVAVQTSLPDSELWVYDLTGRPPIPLRTDSMISSALWEPDGRRVAFLSDSPRSLYRIASDGSESEPETLLRNVNLDTLWAYTPDGREILGETTVGGSRDIMSYPIEGGDPRPLVQTSANETEAALSPDGRWLAYTSDATGQQEIWLRQFDGEGAPIRVSSDGGTEPAWSADGSELFFRRRGPEGVTADMFAATVITEPELHIGTPRVLFAFPFVTPYAPTYGVSPDGRFLMVEGASARGSREIVLVLDWFSELERLFPTP